MGGKKLLKRAFAAFLAVATILTQQSITGYGLNNVQAADGSWVATSYVTNGDFELGDATGWTITSAATTTVKTDSYATNNKTNFFNIYTTTDNTAFSMSQDITLPAGQYYISAKSEGISHDALYTLSLGSVTSKALSASTGWDKWTTDQTDSFTLSESSTLTLTVSGTLTLGSGTDYWGDLDDIVIYKWQDAPKYSYSDLTTLIGSVPTDYTTMGFTSASTTALTDALSTANACTAETDSATLESAYTALSTALDGLVFDGTVFVQKIAGYSNDSIRGVDVSSYLSLMNAFDEINSTITDESKKVGFRDWNGNLLTRQGFFDLLADSGVNYVRLRVWNDPYSSTDASNGYGGGNNDLATAVAMGQYATTAGMKTLIDFHFSDFWADPSKQKAPKAWSAYSVSEKATAISDYVTSSLNTLKTAGVDVGMVQIGNETTGGFCGETSWANMDTLFDAGCDAIHAFNTANSTSILAVLHFTNPEKSGKYATIAANLAAYDGDGDTTNEGVSYDVFASSYYPYWHGTLSNLTSVLSTIATTYDKYVMVAETSWATTYSDGDGHENTINDSGDLGSSASYNVSVQGQTNEVRDVMAAVSGVNVTLKNGDKAGLGMFYWEPAWIPVQYAYNSDGTLNSTTLASNKTLWEKYGCGWASSYAGEYDAKDAGVWYGGSAVDNQAMFDFSGNPLGSLNVFKYAAYGATTTLAIDAYTCSPVSVEVGTTVTSALLPSTVTVTYNDSSTASLTPAWNTDDINKVATAAQKNSGIGSYTVNGTVTLADSSTYPVKCTVSVIAKNILNDYSFENASGSWTITGSGASITSDDPKTGTKSVHFYSSSALDFTVSQTVTATSAGDYAGYIYIQGGSGTGSNTGESIYLTATTSDGTVYTSSNVTLAGWKSWVKPTVSGISVDAGDTITYTLHVKANAGSWGTIDDSCLYLDKATVATSLTLDKDTLSMTYGDTASLTCTTDQDTSIGVPSFTSSNTAVATVDANGNITAVGAGTATITAATTDGSDLTATCTITVAAKDICSASGISAVLDSSSYAYDGTAKTPVVTVSDNGTVLNNGTDYTVAYADNTAVGTATVTITGTGNYTGSITKNFVIAKANRNIKVKTSSYTKVYGSKAFSLNAAISGGGKLTYSSSNKKVATVNSSGKVTLIGYGKATITITSSATSSFNAASAKVTVTVTPKATSLSSVKSTKAGKMTVTWKKGSAASGYLLTYSTSKNFANAKTVTVKSASTTSQSISKLSKGKTYYVKVCSYKTVSGKKIYSSDSSVKKVTIKKK